MIVNNKTTTNLRLPDVRAWWNLPAPAAATIVIFCLIVVAALVGRIRSTPAAAAVPTPGLVILIATPLAVVPPPAAPVVQVAAAAAPAVRYVTAFASPAGAVLGPIPWSDERAILGRWGDDWLMTDWQQANVWVRASDIGMSLANLAPERAPQYQIASQPIAPEPVPTLVLTADEHAVIESALPLSDEQRAASFADHNAQQAAWCVGRDSHYCAMVRAQP